MVAFDALQVAKELEVAFTPEQAEALVRAFARTLTQDLATKQDLDELETRLRTEVKDLRVELKGEVGGIKVGIVKWIVGAIAFNLLGTAGLMITLIKAIPR